MLKGERPWRFDPFGTVRHVTSGRPPLSRVREETVGALEGEVRCLAVAVPAPTRLPKLQLPTSQKQHLPKPLRSNHSTNNQ